MKKNFLLQEPFPIEELVGIWIPDGVGPSRPRQDKYEIILDKDEYRVIIERNMLIEGTP